MQSGTDNERAKKAKRAAAVIVGTLSTVLFAFGCRSETGALKEAFESDRPGTGETPIGSDTGTETATVSGTDTSHGSDADAVPATLLVAPLVHSTTADGFTVNVVTYSGDPATLELFIRIEGEGWVPAPAPDRPAEDVVEWRAEGLQPGTVYQYAVLTDGAALSSLDGDPAEDRDSITMDTACLVDAGPMDGGIYAGDAGGADPGADTDSVTNPIAHPGLLFSGEVVTQRHPSESFRFALLADSHLRPHDTIAPDMDVWAYEELTFQAVIADVAIEKPDFTIHLGDVVDYHSWGFNDPPPSAEVARLAYLNYRRMQSDVVADMTHYLTIGNWEGENGEFTEEEILRSRPVRLLYIPNPDPDTYPGGGGPYEDYYAFTWGDALFIVLNVMSYTETPHRMWDDPGAVDDWTLGDAQLSWFEETLSTATSKWRFVLIHHPVGGNGGDLANSAYGRGGGRAAYVGEQARVHELMLTYGVQIFFYGHDHVFTDMVVDGIHYTLPGSAGAEWKFVTQETGYTEYFFESGHGLVTVTPEKVLVELIAMGGEILDCYLLE